MSLLGIQATAHPDGNRVDLAWKVDPVASIDGVRVVRRTGRYPVHPDDGAPIITTDEETHVSDKGLKAGQIYYYSLFPYQGDPPVYQYDDANRAMSLATAPNGYPQYMLGLLPAIYHRYDKDEQFLARFLEIVGGQIDQFHSLAEFNRRLHDIRQTPGPLLPLLAQWIGWRTDYKRQLDGQRDELRNAPAIYKRIGLMPTLEATIKRISNWESRSKEYVHNVFASNRPRRLNLWSMQRDAGGNWSGDETLQSLDYCYEGRPSIVVDAQGVRWLFYHTERKECWEIWCKTTPVIMLDSTLSSELVAGNLPITIWAAIDAAGLPLLQAATLNVLGPNTNIWEIGDGIQRYVLEQLPEGLRVYDVNADEMTFSASAPQIVSDELNKYPSVALQGDTLWLFWSAYTSNGQWRVHYRRRNDARWTATDPQPEDTVSNPFIEGGVYDATRQRRRAFAVSDDGGGLWLFWQEYNGGWQLRYNRHDGANWGEPVTLPSDGGVDPQVQDDIMAVVSPGTDPRIYLLWARQQAIASGEQRWQVALRVKDNQALDAANWSSVHELPKAIVDNHHDREPYALLNAAGELEVFWASNREDSGWSIWRSTFDLAAESWGAADRITEPVYGQRAPLARPLADGLGLFYRDSRKRIYNSEIYRATEIHDDRYAGSLSIDVRHQQLIRLYGEFEDAQRYTYDTGTDGKRDDGNRIARDTVGAFLNTDTLSEQEIGNGIARLREVVKEFMPMTDRAVFIPTNSLQTEYVYNYSLPPTSDSRYIVSTYTDDWVSSLETSALGPEEDFDAVLES